MKTILLFFVIAWLAIGCSPHFHLDLLGEDQIEEVTLVKSQSQEKILLLDITGIIGSSIPSGLFEKEGNILSRIYFRLEKASQDKMIKGVILRLDTPGGEVTASDILYHEILNFRKKTGIPVVALMMGLAASGGYYIAAACDYIIAHPSTITGSIGVISIFPNLEELLSKIGIKVTIIKSGKMKDSGSTFRALNHEEEQIFQGIVDNFYQKFLKAVYDGRNGSIELEDLKKIADGRVYTADQALNLKLIDEIGYFDSAYKKALNLTRLKHAKVVTYTFFPRKKSNIYATQLKPPTLLENSDFKKIFESLKTGFYYLWLPQITY